MPKVAHLLTTFYRGKAAHGRTFALAADQQQRGWQVEFITGRNADPELIREKQEQGFPVTQILSLRKYVHPRDELRALAELVSLFHRKKYDLVHTHWAKAGILGRTAGRLAGVKRLVHSVYGPTFAPVLPRRTRLLYRSLEKLASLVTSKFIFIGKEIQESYISAGICTPLNSQVIYGGRDISPFIEAAQFPEPVRQAARKSLGLTPQDAVIGYTARIVPSKGHIYALRALRDLKSGDHQGKLVFVGGTWLSSERGFEAQLKKQIHELGLENDVLLLGWQENTAHFYGLFDIFIFPSLYEGLPGAVLEARAADLPVVGFNCGGVREILGDNGNLVAIKDVAGLARALKNEICRLPETRARRGQNLAELKRLQDRFSVDRMLAKTAQLYEDLLDDTATCKNHRSRI